MDKLKIYFLMIIATMSLLAISLDLHVSTLLKCWHVLWVLVGHMCNVNMFSHLVDNYVLWAHIKFIHYYMWSWDEV